MKQGFVKINRDIVDWQWYKEPLTSFLYMHLIITANWCDNTFKGIEIKRGERVISYANLANETGMSVQNVRTALSHMISTGELTKRQSGKYTVISVKNYDSFQSSNKVANKNINNYPNNALTTNKEYIRINKEIQEDEEEKITSSSVVEVVELFKRICKSLPTPMITAETEANIRRAISFYGIDKIKTVFETVENTPFLAGKVKNWYADINWIFLNNNIDNILGGKYRQYNSKNENNEFDVDKYSFVINNF